MGGKGSYGGLRYFKLLEAVLPTAFPSRFEHGQEHFTPLPGTLVRFPASDGTAPCALRPPSRDTLAPGRDPLAPG